MHFLKRVMRGHGEIWAAHPNERIDCGPVVSDYMLQDHFKPITMTQTKLYPPPKKKQKNKTMPKDYRNVQLPKGCAQTEHCVCHQQ